MKNETDWGEVSWDPCAFCKGDGLKFTGCSYCDGYGCSYTYHPDAPVLYGSMLYPLDTICPDRTKLPEGGRGEG